MTTGYIFYYDYENDTWSQDSADWNPIPRDGQKHDLWVDLGSITQKTASVDRTTVEYYNGHWYDYNNQAVGTGSQFYKPGDSPPRLHVKLLADTAYDTVCQLNLLVKHSGSLFDDYGVTLYARVATRTAISLMTGTGDTIYTEAIEKSSVLDPVPTYSRAGYELGGWYTGQQMGTKIINDDGTLVPNVAGYTDSDGKWCYTGSTLTLYAYWTERTYSVTKDYINCTGYLQLNAAGSYSSLSGVRYHNDTVAMLWTAPQQESGFRIQLRKASFQGYNILRLAWEDLKVAQSDDGALTLNEDQDLGSFHGTVRAHVEYTRDVLVTVNTSDASKGSVAIGSTYGPSVSAWVSVLSGSGTVSIRATTAAGWQFANWSDGSTEQIRSLTVTQATTLTAYFEEAEYCLSVDAGTGGYIARPSVGYEYGHQGDVVNIEAVPQQGYSFKNWTIYYSPTSATPPTIASSTSASTTATIGTSHAAVTANFQIQKTGVRLEANCEGGTYGQGEVVYNGTTMTVSNAPSRTGGSTGWTLTEYYLDAACTKRIAYLSGSSWRLDASVVYNGTTYTDSSGRWVRSSDSATFYAKWVGKSVTVTFNANGGSVSPTSQTKNYGSTYGDMPVPTHSDSSKCFLGWYTASSAGDLVESSTTVTRVSNHTLYAHWGTGFIVAFNANGGYCGTASKTVQNGSTYGTLPTPTWSGHTFAGWYTSASGGTEITSSTVVSLSGNQTLYAHWDVPINTFTLTYDANGGSGAPSSVSVTEEGTVHTFTVSSTEPTRSMHTFAGWGESSSSTVPDYLPGAIITVDPGTTTLHAVWIQNITPEGSTIDNVRIYKKGIGGGLAPNQNIWTDVSDRLAQRSVITETENYGMTATFTVVNPAKVVRNGQTVEDNILALNHVWSNSSTGPVDVGMFVCIRHASESGMPWGWFLITSITVNDDLVTVTCGDYIQLLRATGADYYRNHYDPNGYSSADASVHWSANVLYIDKPSDATLSGGSVGDVKVMAPATVATASYDQEIHTYNRRIWTYFPLRSDIIERPDANPAALVSVGVELKTAATYQVKVYEGSQRTGTPFASGSVTKSGTSWETKTFTLPTPILIKGDTTITIELYATGTVSSGVYYRVSALADATTYYKNDDLSDQEVAGHSLTMSLGVLKYANATGAEDPNDDTRWNISAVDTVTTLDQTLAATVNDVGGSSVPRGWIEYYDPEAGIPISQIVRSICQATRATVAIGVMNRRISMFRCAGGYFHDYLLTLADMTEESGDHEGKQHAFCANQSVWGSMIFGLRRSLLNTSEFYLYYGGDTAPTPGGSQQVIPMLSFNPKKTMQNRPVKAVSRGLDNDGHPIMVCVKDPDSVLGASTSTVESTDTSSVQAALNAYTIIVKNRSKNWEGEAVIDGIHPELMTRSGTYIGGVVGWVVDSRYGMTGGNAMHAKVKEAVFDYQNLTTTLTLNNYSEVYSNSLTDTSKMAYSAGTMTLVESSADMYLRQYVFAEVSSQMSFTADHTHSYTMSITLTDEGVERTQTVQALCIYYPELGVCTFVGYFPAGSAYSSDQYAVQTVRVHDTDGGPGVIVTLSESVRPDKRSEQYLIVNIQAQCE